jgi:hypothetical protein
LALIRASVCSRRGRLRESLAGLLTREVLIATSIAGALAALLAWFGPPGGDFAAHSYQRALFIEHGFSLWNNFWYSGRYNFITYSPLYYPLAALLGIRLLAVVSVAAAVFAFTVVVSRQWGPVARWSSRSFAVLWAGAVLTAAFPFILGIAFALFALWALQVGARWWFAAFVVLALAASPNAFVLLGVVVLGIGVARIEEEWPHAWRRPFLPAAILIACALTELLIMRVFPGEGYLPFAWADLLPACVFCVLGALLAWRVKEARLLRWIFPVYLAACLALFIIPTGLGHNIARLRFFALPVTVLLVALRDFRPRLVVVAALVLALSWNASPLIVNYRQERGVSESSRSYWQPAIGYLRAHLSPSYRVEVVDTVGHWAAAYLPQAGIPIARGWFRQDDFPQNSILYRDFGARAYLRWLQSLGVRYVVLTGAPPDYSARAEGELLKSGRSGLRRVFRTPDITIYAVPSPHALISGPGHPRVLSLKRTELRLRLDRIGTYRLAVRYSPYLRASGICLRKSADGMTELVTRHGVVTRLEFDFDLGRALDVLGGSVKSGCS